jgi:ABC-type amino acid transport substrate-binding protein
VITDRFRVVLGASHLITLTLLTIAASAGFLHMKKKKALEGAAVVLIALVVSIVGVNLLIKQSMKNIPTNKERINAFRLISPEQPYKVLKKAAPNPRPRWRGENDLSRIKRRGRLRVGYYPNSMPFAFRNSDSLLVGYGIDLAHQLAADLKVSLEFVPVEPGRLIYGMQHDYYDIIMSDIFLSSHYAEKLMLSKPYLHVSLALITPKENNNFDSYQSAAKLDTFNISYFERQEIAEEFLSFLPHGHAWPIHDLDQFFRQDPEDSVHYDAHLTSAERASALTIFYPDYKMVNPLPYHIRNSLVFPLNKDDVWRRYVDKWIDYRTGDGTLKRIYDQWILGYEYQKEKKTWSILHDVILPRFQPEKEEVEK